MRHEVQPIFWCNCQQGRTAFADHLSILVAEPKLESQQRHAFPTPQARDGTGRSDPGCFAWIGEQIGKVIDGLDARRAAHHAGSTDGPQLGRRVLLAAPHRLVLLMPDSSSVRMSWQSSLTSAVLATQPASFLTGLTNIRW